MSILNETLSSFDYYKNKLPLYLQNSDGFISHFKIWFDFLVGKANSGIYPVSEEILDLMNIFDKDFLTKIKDLPGSGADPEVEYDYGTNSDILDKLASLFGVSRRFSCTYTDDNNDVVTESLVLNNEDLLTLIKCQIIQNYNDGSYEQIKSFYEDVGLYTFIITEPNAMVDLILGVVRDANPGDQGYYSDNIKKMFSAGLLRVENLGIIYSTRIFVFGNFLLWDSNDEEHVWDTGIWGL